MDALLCQRNDQPACLVVPRSDCPPFAACEITVQKLALDKDFFQIETELTFTTISYNTF